MYQLYLSCVTFVYKVAFNCQSVNEPAVILKLMSVVHRSTREVTKKRLLCIRGVQICYVTSLSHLSLVVGVVTYVFVISASVDIYVVHSDSVVKLHSDMLVTLSSASIH